jgi:hypothetical protein
MIIGLQLVVMSAQVKTLFLLQKRAMLPLHSKASLLQNGNNKEIL